MKKVLIVLLSVLLLVSFVSCEKDKSEEIIKNLEDFYKAKNICESATNLLEESAYTGNDLTLNDIASGELMDCLYYLGIEDYSDLNEITAVTGSATFTDGKKSYNDIVMTYTNDDGSEHTFSFSGTFDGSTASTIYKMRVTGTDYSVSWTKDSNGKYTAASVNGNDVEVRLLNSTTSSGVGM